MKSPHGLGRISLQNTPRRMPATNQAVGYDNTIVPNIGAIEYHSAGTDPDIIANLYSLRCLLLIMQMNT